jgi:hypothetical protein
MGKQVQINPGYSFVLLPGVAKPANDSDVVDLTDAEYAALDPGTLLAVTLLGTVTDPIRTPDGVQVIVVADSSNGHFYEIGTAAGVVGATEVS